MLYICSTSTLWLPKSIRCEKVVAWNTRETPSPGGMEMGHSNGHVKRDRLTVQKKLQNLRFLNLDPEIDGES